MAELKGREIKTSAVSKTAVDQGNMDLTGFRVGKQRLVSKKKKTSALKKTIMEDREDRKAEDLGNQPIFSTASRVDSKALSLDAPEFVPAGWSAPEFMPSGWPSFELLSGGDASVDPAAASTISGKFSTGNLVTGAGGEQRAEAEPTAKEVQARHSHGNSQSSKKAQLDTSSTPVFVPSWCLGPSEQEPQEEGKPEREVSAAQEWLDNDLPVTEAIERMRTLQEGKQKRVEEKKQKTQQSADIEVRHYVHQVLSDELDDKVKVMLGELVRFQERAKERDPLKYEKQKRLCVGMREAKRAVLRNKCKGLIVAPNLEESQAEGGLDDTVEDLIEVARDCDVPVVFALSRNRIGKALGKNMRLSIVAILSAEGAFPQFKEIIKLTDALRKQWVMRQMSRITDEDAEEARRAAAERAERNAQRKIERAQKEEERKAEVERLRLEERERKAAEKARKAAERQAEIEKRRAEKLARLNDPEVLAEKARREEEKKVAEEKKRAAEEAAKEQERRQAEKLRREQKKKEEEERRRAEEEKKRQEEEKEKRREEKAAAGDEESDSDSSEDLPLGFSAELF